MPRMIFNLSNDRVYGCFIFRGKLSAEELLSLHIDPFQLLERRTTWVSFAEAAGLTLFPIKKPWVRKPTAANSKIDHKHPLARGMIGGWLFNEGAGGIVRDLIHSNDAGLEGGTTWSRVNGELGALCDANGSVVVVPSTPTLNPTGDITLFARFKPIAAIGDGGDGTLHGIILNHEAQYNLVVNTNGNLIFNGFDAADINVDVGDWGTDFVTVVATLKGTTSEVYLNGVSWATGTTNRSGSSNGKTKFWNGDGDEAETYDRALDGEGSCVYIYNRAFSAEEVVALDANYLSVLWVPLGTADTPPVGGGAYTAEFYYKVLLSMGDL